MHHYDFLFSQGTYIAHWKHFVYGRNDSNNYNISVKKKP